MQFRSRFFQLALGILSLVGITACSGGSGAFPRPGTDVLSALADAHSYTSDHAKLVALGKARQETGLYQSPVPPEDSFSTESGIDITDHDIDRFIDAPLNGEDRKLAKLLMSQMSRDKRGDFLYVGSDGRVVSNRLAIKLAYLASVKGAASLTRTISAPQLESVRRPLQYPPVANSNQGGLLLREYSQPGITSGFGFVTVPCYDINLNPTSRGDLYFGENGYSTGQTEGGLQVTQNSSYSGNESIQLYARSTAVPSPDNQGGYAPVQYPTHYSCGQAIEVLYGHLPSPNAGKFFASASLPQYSPGTYTIPGGTVVSTNVSYVFSDLPIDFTGGGYDPYTQISTPCSRCFTRRMTTIAQTSGSNEYSGECFGECHSNLGIRWEQVHMGQTTYFNNTPQLITIHMPVSSTAWYADTEVWPNDGRIGRNGAGANSINSEYEGIYAAPTFGSGLTTSAAGSFGQLQPLPGPCTTDVNGACGWYSNVNTTVCDTGDTSSTAYVHDWQYNGYSAASGQVTTFYGTMQLSSGCQITPAWAPNDPRSFYQDVNLPGPLDSPPYPGGPITGDRKRSPR